MKVVMTFGDDSRTLDLASMPIREAAECERLTGWTWTEWRTHLAEDRANAVAFAWWLAGRRAGLDVGKFTDVDLDLAKLRWAVELSDEEQAQVDAAEEAADDEDPDLPTGPGDTETLTD